jgi:outer membrane lipase/esterase
MPRTKHLASALALALAGMSTAQAQEFSAVISFGDSLSDAGQYAALPPPFYFGAQGSFTTNPDDVWTQVLASSYGLSQTASLAGGTNYAWGGAPTSFAVQTVPFPLQCVPATLPCRSVAQQIGQHLAANGGHADGDALYTYWAGANDLFNYLGAAGAGLITSGQAQQFTGASAATAVGEIAALQAAGAQHIVVLNLPDIGLTPSFRGTASQASVSGLVFVYNDQFNQRLASLADGIIPINAYGLINEVIADPAAYGFSNVTGTACNLALTGGSSLFCTPAAYVSSDANETYLFADGVHPSGAAHAMLARVVQATIAAPGQVSMAGEMPLLVYENHANVLNGQFFTMDRVATEKGESNVYGQIQYGNADFDATVNTAAFDSNVTTATLGADVRYTDHITLGGAVTFGATRGDSHASDIDGKEVLASLYGVANWDYGYVNVILTGGNMSLDIDRAIDFRASTRSEQGNTDARHFAFELGGGFSFGGENLHHGPFASLTGQDVKVRDYSEDSLDSTAMWFKGFTRRAQVWRLGYQAEGNWGSVRPYARVAFAHDSEQNDVRVQAGSNTMNGHFTFDGYIPSERWFEGDVGLAWAYNDSTEMSFAWRGHFNDEGQDRNTLSIGFRKEFGGVVEAAPEPVAAEPVQTCADLDDDGDGINNCDDKCPTSASGETVGPDGCVAPAPEPEPEMAPKPFRN